MLRWWWFPPHNAMFWTVTLSLLQGMRQAAVLFGLTLAFSLPLGLLVALGSMSRCRPVRAVFDALVWVIRGTPLVLQLIIIFTARACGWAGISGAATGCWRASWPLC